MRVFVTGAAGAIGCHAVPTLVAAGHQVTALARTDTKAQQLRKQGATPVSASLFDRDALAAGFAGHDVVVNLATALPPTHRASPRSLDRCISGAAPAHGRSTGDYKVSRPDAQTRATPSGCERLL
jgi:uncharacterized protein YbjT (DUF2867 family)